MKALLTTALIALAAFPLVLRAQQPPQGAPVAGLTLRLQLVDGDTSIKTRDTLAVPLDKASAAVVQCARTEGGKPRGPGSACGPKYHGLALLEERTVTTDAQGHATDRFTWAGGEATVEIDVTDMRPGPRGPTVHLKTAFGPKLRNDAGSAGAVRASASVPLMHLLVMSIFSERGAMILTVRPEAMK